MFDRVYPPAIADKDKFKEPFDEYIDISRQYFYKFTGLNKREKNLTQNGFQQIITIDGQNSGDIILEQKSAMLKP